MNETGELITASPWPERAIQLYGGKTVLAAVIAEKLDVLPQVVPTMMMSEILDECSMRGIMLSSIFPCVTIPAQDLRDWIIECERRETEVLSPLPEGTDVEKARADFGTMFLQMEALDALCAPEPVLTSEDQCLTNELHQKCIALMSLPITS